MYPSFTPRPLLGHPTGNIGPPRAETERSSTPVVAELYTPRVPRPTQPSPVMNHPHIFSVPPPNLRNRHNEDLVSIQHQLQSQQFHQQQLIQMMNEQHRLQNEKRQQELEMQQEHQRRMFILYGTMEAAGPMPHCITAVVTQPRASVTLVF